MITIDDSPEGVVARAINNSGPNIKFYEDLIVSMSDLHLAIDGVREELHMLRMAVIAKTAREID